jgi:anti-sigma factor RsiW
VNDQHATLLLGAYVLGSLDERERQEVDDHLRTCPACAAELAELEPMRAILAQVDMADIEAYDVTPPPDLFARMTAAVDDAELPPPPRSAAPPPAHPVSLRHPESRRRPRARILVAAAAAVVALAGSGVGVGVATSGAGPRPTFSAAAGSVHMTARIEGAQTGTTLHVTVSGLPVNEHCTLVAVAHDGARHPAGQWVASYAGKAQITTATDISRDQLHQLVLLGTDGQTLVTMTV